MSESCYLCSYVMYIIIEFIFYKFSYNNSIVYKRDKFDQVNLPPFFYLVNFTFFYL